MSRSILFILLVSYSLIDLKAQDDLLNLTEQKPEKQYVFASWKAYRLGNAQTTETVKKNHLEYRILHRFGNLADNTKTFNQIAHTAFGIDNPTDIRMSLEYGLTNDLTIGIGRSRVNELVDLSGKWRIIKQTTDFKTPVTIALFESVGYTTMTTSRMYSEVAVKDFPTREAHRLNYVTQLIIGSKLNRWISVEVLPTWFHKNFVVQKFNPNSGVDNGNDEWILGIAARLKLSNRVTFFADYFYNFHPFYRNNPDYAMPLSIGFEVETGGHVFTLFFANNSAI
ncbi:MAG: DUF5777 family beta-barrel protein, partial [Bacteroidia bacterium]|nr:DUF5777 family beta-barrel protein [Bacteroidia bacterium]